MSKKFPIHPAHPERTCWGCDLYCPASSMACGNGADRTQHPVELFGEDWQEWGLLSETKEKKPALVLMATTVPSSPSSSSSPSSLPASPNLLVDKKTPQ